MRQSKLFVKTLREDPKDEVSANARLLVRAGFIDKLMAGVYTYLPMGFRVLKKIENIIREEMDEIGGKEVLMPALHPLENYVKTGRDKIDILFHTESVTGNKLVLGQSHEEVIVPLVKKFIQSYKDLPLVVYQIQTKFRNELRAKSGIFRGREFLMKDMYSFHLDEDDFNEFYERVINAYRKIFDRVGIGGKTHITYASGGTFSKYSHEFQTLTDAGEDTIYLCEKCREAINREIRDEVKKCLKCGETSAAEKKSIEVGNVFPLKSKFSDAFGLAVKDEKGSKHSVIMGCYGIGLGRLMGAIAEIHNDARGIIWPEGVAPFKIHLISLGDGAKKEAEKLYYKLLAKKAEVLYDDRDDKTAGEKFADADLIGIPFRVVASDKTLEKNGFEIKSRLEKEVKVISETEFWAKFK
jgi:prolyl-tRNA synthetase